MFLFKSDTWHWMLATFMLGMFFPLAQSDRTLAQDIEVLSQFPHVIEGRSGGSTYNNDCGYISGDPVYTFRLTQPMGEMLAIVETPEAAGADMTLMLEGPDGRVCVDDTGTSLMPEYGGTWSAGEYRVWVGDWGDSRNFSLQFVTE